MLILPVETPDHAADALIVILDQRGVDRMRQADPAEVILRDTGKRLVNPSILLCLEEQTPELARVVQTRDVRQIIAFLQRGFQFRPEEGDHDRGPERLSDTN